MAALDRLPPELTNKIVNLLKRSDTESQTHLRNLRLVNRALSVVATPFVFATVPLWIGMHSLKNLNNIAQHPLLSKLVTKIAFEPLRAIETYDEGELQKSVKDYFDYQNSSLNDSTIAVGQYLAARKRYANEQQFLDRDDTDRRILVRALRSLSCLRSIDIVMCSATMAIKEMTKSFGRLDNTDITTDPLRQIRVFSHAMEDSGIQVNSIRILAQENACPLVGMVDGINSDRLSKAPSCDILVPSSQMRLLFNDQQHFSHLLPCLDDFQMTVPASTDRAEFVNAYRLLRYALKKTLHVSTFGLVTCNHTDNSTIDHTRLVKEFTSASFSRLRNLNLYGLRTNNLQSLSRFLIDHSHTLETVNLWGVKAIEEGNNQWSGVLNAMSQNQYKWRSLRSFRLTQCLNREWELDIAHFLKHQTIIPFLDTYMTA